MIPNTREAWSDRASLPTSHEAALWSAAGQQERFAAVLVALDPRPGEELLDYGCGTGSLSAFLGEEVKYVGYDWAPGMRARARRDHPAAAFSDVMPLRHFDLIACVGTFNLADGWSKTLTWETLRLLWKMTDRALAACLYAGDGDDHLSYAHDELLGFEIPGSPVRFVERHRHNDLLLVLYRPPLET